MAVQITASVCSRKFSSFCAPEQHGQSGSEVERVAVPAEASREGWDLNALDWHRGLRTSGLGSSRSTGESGRTCSLRHQFGHDSSSSESGIEKTWLRVAVFVVNAGIVLCLAYALLRSADQDRELREPDE